MTLVTQFLAKKLPTSIQCQIDFLLTPVKCMLLDWPEIWTKQVQWNTYGIIYHNVQRVLITK